MSRALHACGRRAAVAAQAALAATVLLALGLAPPVHGRTLLVPVDGKPISQDLLDRWMLAKVGQGPLPGSLVVDGKGRELSVSLFEKGIVMLAAPAAICGGRSPGERNG